LEKSKESLNSQEAIGAIWMLQAAILIDPDLAELHYYLGVAFSQHAIWLREQNKVQEAELNFYQAIRYLVNAAELNPRMGEAFYYLGFVFRKLGMDQESRKCLEKYMMLGLEDGTYHSRGALDGASLPG
jgi:tetratricopeptide (TPR) repeat protein